MGQNRQLDAWTGSFGRAYMARNSDVSVSDLDARADGLSQVMETCAHRPRSILEVGANIGRNLMALRRLTDATLHAVEPFVEAFERMRELLSDELSSAHNCAGDALPFEDTSIDFVFTSGVLIHVHPDRLPDVMAEIHRVSRRYVWCNEYFATQPESIGYRGEDGLLFKRDFGRLYQKLFPDLHIVGTGFLWSAATPFDDTVWWLFEKQPGGHGRLAAP